MRTCLLCILCALASFGCSRSPAEQLAYQHAAQQSQLNRENFARYRQALDDDDDDGEDAAPAVAMTSTGRR